MTSSIITSFPRSTSMGYASSSSSIYSFEEPASPSSSSTTSRGSSVSSLVPDDFSHPSSYATLKNANGELLSGSEYAFRLAEDIQQKWPIYHVLVLGYEPEPGHVQLLGTRGQFGRKAEKTEVFARVNATTAEGPVNFSIYVFALGRFCCERKGEPHSDEAWGFASPGWSKYAQYLFFDQIISD